MTSFAAQIEEWVRETEQRMLATVQIAVQDLIKDMQTPVTKGGRMRVDTGFLRASGRASLTGWPSGPSQKPADAPTGQYTGIYDDFDAYPLGAVLLDLKLGDTLYFGWVAGYATVRNTYDGFMDIPVQNWQGYVNTAMRKVKGGR